MFVRFLLLLSVLSQSVFAADANRKIFLDEEHYIWNPQCSRYELDKQWCKIQEIAPEAIKDGSQLAITFAIPDYSPTTLTATVKEQRVKADFKTTYDPAHSMKNFLDSLKGKCFATREYIWNQAQDGIKQESLPGTFQIPRIEFSKPHQLLYFYDWSLNIDKALHKTDIFVIYGFLPPDDPVLANQEIDKLLKRKQIYTFHHDSLKEGSMKGSSGEDILEMEPCGLLRSVHKVKYLIETPEFLEWKRVNNDLQSLEPYAGFVTEEELTTGIALQTDSLDNLSGYITRDTASPLSPKLAQIVYYSRQDTFHLCVPIRGRYQFREKIDGENPRTIPLTVARYTPIQLALSPHATFDEYFQSGSYYLLESSQSSETATSQVCHCLNSAEPFDITITSAGNKKEPFAAVDLTEALSDPETTVSDVFSILKQTLICSPLLTPWSRLLEISFLGKSADQQQLIIHKYLDLVEILYANRWRAEKSALQIKSLNQLPLTQLNIDHTNFDVVNLLLYLQSTENYKNADQQIGTMDFNLHQLDSSKFPDYPNQVVKLIKQFKAKKVNLEIDFLKLVNQKSTQPLINFILSQQTTAFNLKLNTVAFMVYNPRDFVRPYTDDEVSTFMSLTRGVEKAILDSPLFSFPSFKSPSTFIILLEHNRETLRQLYLTPQADISPLAAQKLISIIPQLSNLEVLLFHLNQENSTALKPIIPVLQNLKKLSVLIIGLPVFRISLLETVSIGGVYYMDDDILGKLKKLPSSIQVTLRFSCPGIDEYSIDIDLKDQEKIEQYKKRLKSYNPFHQL
mgnify:CR=1 FL=1